MFLKVENLNKIYHSGKIDFQALYNIDLAINQGEFIALCGPSGSGKTTLLNCIGCIDNYEQGAIILNGENLKNKSSDELAVLRRKSFGFIFQTYNLIPVLNVFENIELPLRLLNQDSEKEAAQKVMELLHRVGLDNLEKRYPMELSGGQQQRVSIARALIKKPLLVLADEPTANLDSKTGESIVDIMKSLNENLGTTFIFSTHDPLVMSHAKRLVNLKDGKIDENSV
jgi:putative ABC transport system ATP-binding protein